ncbi:hypothetical protein [Umezawaea sp. Da 62-37]|uniref:hypothetical protein n=1 Tax=Umezawaea sp. Da 62-37 TaxID=3075927 RepID=UPI0028F70961|nr:hypothetical protein [Umezawaea sp. Da 62-37]WNV87851.1 hypothetical protein RM788_06085 [Umezawaea sp. Da 62-37]
MPKVKKPPRIKTTSGAGIFTPIGKSLRKSKRPAGSDVKVLEVGRYGDLKRREKVGDNLEHDHIPSSAALKKAEEKRLGRKLTSKELAEIHRQGAAIEIPNKVHAKSDTYRGKNTKSQIDSDAADLSAAAKRDYETTRKNLIADGHSPADVDAALDKMKALNKAKGI